MHSDAELPSLRKGTPPSTSTLRSPMHALAARHRKLQDYEDMSFDSSNAYQKIFPPRFHLLDRELAESTLVILRSIKKAYPGEGIRRTVLWLQ
jgi:hypothetical protein